MKGYISYFKTVLLTGMQYKTAAMAGVLTQFFWGFLQIFIFQAFYEGTGTEVPMDFNNLVTYVWLQQALFALVYIRHKDEDVANSIKNGTVSYELIRPYDMYSWWFVKCAAKKIAAVTLRFLPIILVSLLLPEPYKLQLPASLGAFLMFLLNLLLGIIILTGIILLTQIITFYTYDDKGITGILFTIAELLSGLSLPLPLLPNIIQKIAYVLPFRLIGDLPFRIYSGDIPMSQCIENLGFQIFWIIALIVIGKVLMNSCTKKVYIQGG